MAIKMEIPQHIPKFKKKKIENTLKWVKTNMKYIKTVGYK